MLILYFFQFIAWYTSGLRIPTHLHCYQFTGSNRLHKINLLFVVQIYLMFNTWSELEYCSKIYLYQRCVAQYSLKFFKITITSTVVSSVFDGYVKQINSNVYLHSLRLRKIFIFFKLIWLHQVIILVLMCLKLI